MEKFFNIAGVVDPARHYFISHRLDEQQLKEWIARAHYFVLHAPRQSGKTTAIIEFMHSLCMEETYKPFYINLEAAQAARGRVEEAMRTILDRFRAGIVHAFSEEDPAIAYLDRQLEKQHISGNALYAFLQFWAKVSLEREGRFLVLFIDEVDSLVGDTLISVLRQLRDGYLSRPKSFPQSICLFGVRDVRDYRIWSDSQQATILGGSAFNIKAESLTLRDFSFQEVQDLYLQHTKASGQVFTQEALAFAFMQTQGQPWLVNALAYQACFRDVQDRSVVIDTEILQRAKEVLIKRCDTHLDKFHMRNR